MSHLQTAQTLDPEEEDMDYENLPYDVLNPGFNPDDEDVYDTIPEDVPEYMLVHEAATALSPGYIDMSGAAGSGGCVGGAEVEPYLLPHMRSGCVAPYDVSRPVRLHQSDTEEIMRCASTIPPRIDAIPPRIDAIPPHGQTLPHRQNIQDMEMVEVGASRPSMDKKDHRPLQLRNIIILILTVLVGVLLGAIAIAIYFIIANGGGTDTPSTTTSQPYTTDTTSDITTAGSALPTGVLTIIGGYTESATDSYYRTYTYTIDNDLALTYTGTGDNATSKVFISGYAREGSMLYLVGGGDGNPAYSTAMMYDGDTGVYNTSLPDTSTPRGRCPPTFILSGSLYVAGGQYYDNTWQYPTSMESVPLSGGNWSPHSVTLPYNVHSTMAVVREGRVYIPAGYSSTVGTYLNSMISWAEGETSWSASHATLNTGRYSHCTVLCGGYMWVIGGWNDTRLDSLEMFDFDKEEWSVMQPLSEGLYWMGCDCYNRHIILTGGRGSVSGSFSDTVYMYDLDTDSWHLSTTRLEQGVYGHVSVIF